MFGLVFTDCWMFRSQDNTWDIRWLNENADGGFVIRRRQREWEYPGLASCVREAIHCDTQGWMHQKETLFGMQCDIWSKIICFRCLFSCCHSLWVISVFSFFHWAQAIHSQSNSFLTCITYATDKLSHDKTSGHVSDTFALAEIIPHEANEESVWDIAFGFFVYPH